MLLQLRPYHTNKYNVGGILIADSSPYFWLQELERMQLPVHKLKIFAIPSTTANKLFGCLIVTDVNLNKTDLGKNNKLQLVENKLFIPENTIIFPQLTTEDWERLFTQHFYFMHPQLGLIELDEEVDWSKIISAPKQAAASIKKPAESVRIPSVIRAYKLEIPEEGWIENIANSESEKELLEKMPFDMKKVMEGNQKEIDKYLEFMDKHPELALKYAIPVDLMGTSRGKEWAKFHFKDNSWWSKILDKLFSSSGNSTAGSSGSGSSSNVSNANVFKYVAIFILTILGVGVAIKLFTGNSAGTSAGNPVTESAHQSAPLGFFSWILILGSLILISYIVLRLLAGIKTAGKNKYKSTSSNNSDTTSGTPSPTIMIPSAINWETLKVTQQTDQNPISFGTPDMSAMAKIICAVILCLVLSYLFYPLINRFGLNWVNVSLLILFAWLLFKLVSTDKFILKTEEKETQSFSDKLLAFCMCVYLFKLLAILYSFSYLPFLSVVGSLVIFVVSGIIIGLLIVGLTSGSSGDGGNVYVDSGRFNALTERYEKLAQEYIKKGDYTRAAYIYLKLLKNPYKAAETLLDGKQYQNAAYVFLKQCQNKSRAAECYEQGKLYPAAIELYKELEQDEKIGDLYSLMYDRRNAAVFYNKVIEKYTNTNQYVKASLIYRNKMQDYTSAQNLLLTGWEKNLDGINCLNNYFANISDVKLLAKEIQNIYETKTTAANKNNFLQVIKHEYNKNEHLEDVTQNIAYEIIAEEIMKNRNIIQELKHFTKKDKNILKDIMRFKLFSK